MVKITESQIRQCSVFADGSSSTIDIFSENFRLINFEKGRQIVGQEDNSSELYLMVEGVARAKSYSEAGKEVSYRDIGGGELFGEFSAIDDMPRSAAIVAVNNCVVAKLPSSIFREAVKNDSNVAMALIELLVEKNRGLTERIHEFGTLAVRHRIQSELLRLAAVVCEEDANSAQFKIPTHMEFANRICTHREAVTKELNYLTSVNLISVEKSTVTIGDYQRFRQVTSNLGL